MVKHIGELKNNRHKNTHLQGAWNLYGEKIFSFYLVKECSLDKLDEIEIFYIKKHLTTNENFGYNREFGGNKNKIASIKTRRKQSRLRKGRKLSKESIEAGRLKRMGDKNWIFGKHLSKETKEKIYKKLSGKKNPMYGKPAPTLCKKRKNSTSKYLGVCVDRKRKLWRAFIFIKGKLITIGRFTTEKRAARAYDKYIIENNIKNRLFNF